MNGNVETMEYRGQRLFTLLGNLRQDLTDMIKSEISATVSSMGKDGVTILIGGFIAYTGAVLALIGLATLVAFAIHKAGLSVLMAMWISFLAFGLLVAFTGYMLLKSGISKFKEVKVAPKETISTRSEERRV